MSNPYRVPGEQEKSLNARVLNALKAYSRSVVRYDPNPYQHEPYDWMFEDQRKIDALINEFESSLKE